MRVLVVTPWFPSQKKPGSGTFMWRDAELLHVTHRVTVFHLAERSDLDRDEAVETQTESGIAVIRHEFDPLSPASMLRASQAIRQRLRQADIVHSMSLHALFPVRLAKPSIPWVHTEHWSGLMQPTIPVKKRIGRLLYRSSLSKPDEVVAVGERLAASMKGYVTGDVDVIPNHVALGSPEHRPEPPEARGDSPLRLVAIGNLIDHKGPFPAIDAVNELRSRGVCTSLTWVGDGPLKAALIERIHELRLSKAISLPGQVLPSRIPEVLRRAHLFILPTRSETFGVAFAEALGHGLPVVATGHGGHVTFLPHRASRIAAERDGTSLADAVYSLISDPNRWSSSQIQTYARGLFSEQVRRKSYAAVYERLG